MTSPKPKVRKVAWAVLGVVVLALVVLIPMLYEASWKDLPGPGSSILSGLDGILEQENQMTGSSATASTARGSASSCLIRPRSSTTSRS